MHKTTFENCTVINFECFPFSEFIKSTQKAAAIAMPSAKVLARVQMLTIALNALTLKTESSVSLNVHSRSIPRTEIVSIVMSHAMVAKVQETQFPMMDVLIVKTLSLTEPFKSVSRKIQLAQVRLQEG